MGILISIAAIVTPLGLYQTLLPSHEVQPTFQYIRDTGPFGFGTPPRSNFSLNRVCGNGFVTSYMPCPFTDTIVTETVFSNDTIGYDIPYGIDMNIPETIKNSTYYGSIPRIYHRGDKSGSRHIRRFLRFSVLLD